MFKLSLFISRKKEREKKKGRKEGESKGGRREELEVGFGRLVSFLRGFVF